MLLVMRSQGVGAVLRLILCGTALAGFAQQSEQDAASKIVALENAWNRSSESKDLKALDRILNAAFIYVDESGKLMTKAEMLKDVKESNVRTVTLESIVVHVHGGSAVATGIYRMKGLERGKLFVRRGRFVDTWLYADGQWVAIASVGTPLGE
jgi:ketosteroid isomerase-like protein